MAKLKGKGLNPTHHIVLTDGYKEVGFILSDTSGEREERVFKRFPVADPSKPDVTETQSEWGSGMGQKTFEENRTKFWQSQGVDTTKGAVTLGPMFYYGLGGYRDAVQYLPEPRDSVTNAFGWYSLSGSKLYRAQKFQAASTFTPKYVRLWARRDGLPDSMNVYIYSDSAGVPGSQLGQGTLDELEMYDGEARFVKVTVSCSEITQGSWYWVIFKGIATAPDFFRIGGDATYSEGNSKHSSNGSTWYDSSYQYYFRVEAAEKKFKAHWYEYKGQLYFARQFDEYLASDIWMNGWRGVCDDNTGTKDRLKDSTQTGWSAALLKDCVAKMVGGNATAALEDWRKVTGGASGYATVTPDWDYVSTSYDDYVITGSNYFYSLPSTPITHRITDVASMEGLTIFCQGEMGHIQVHREYNKDGVWTADSTTNCWKTMFSLAHFVQTLNDPMSGPVIWFGRNSGFIAGGRPLVWKAFPVDWDASSSSFDRIVLSDMSTDWTTASELVIVYTAKETTKTLNIKIIINRVETVTVDTGGSGYQVDDILTLTEVGASPASVKVLTIDGGGAVLTVSVEVKGYDYTTGVKDTTGGNGTGCKINVTSLASFNTGLLGYTNLSELLDVRQATKLRLTIMSNKNLGNGDLEFVLDNDLACASPFIEIPLPTLIEQKWYTDQDATFDASEITGANAVQSVGFNLSSAQPKTVEITIKGEIIAINQFPPIYVGQEADNITGLQAYGDPEQLWVFTETGAGEISNNVYLGCPLRELKVARHPRNGVASDVNDVYLYFSWRGRMQRYFRNNLEDLGPDLVASMNSIEGEVSAIQTYAGRLYVAIDGRHDNRSMIMCYKGNGWHPIYISETGERIRSLYVQAIPGRCDKLWFCCGSNVMWLPIILDPTELPSDSDYQYAPIGTLDTSWIYTGNSELNKLFRSILVSTDEKVSYLTGYPTGYPTSGGRKSVEVFYKVDDITDSWSQFTAFEIKNASTAEYFLTSGAQITNVTYGNRLMAQLRLCTTSLKTTPVVRKMQAKIFRVPEVKHRYTWLSRLTTLSINLRGDEEKVLGSHNTVGEALETLDTWGKTMTPLYASSDIDAIDNKVLIIEPMPAQLLMLVSEEKIEEMNVQVVAREV